MKNFIFILALIFSFISASCSGPGADNARVDPIDSIAEIAGIEVIDFENSDRDNWDKESSKFEECEMASCEKYGCDKTKRCLAECMANCENPEKCAIIMESNSTDTACDGGE